MTRVLASVIVVLCCYLLTAGQAVTNETRECAQAKAEVLRFETRLKDWPALARYREANSKIEPPRPNEERVVFMGDSITDWWIRPESGGFFPGKPYLDRGISGQSTQQMLVRFRPDVVGLKPKLVLILAGTNDLASVDSPLESIRESITSMVDLAKLSKIKVVLASLLPVHDYSLDKDGKPIIQSARRKPEEILKANEWLKSYAAENGLTYLDYHSAMVDAKGFLKAELSNDGLHPNSRGYAVMSPLAEQAIAGALKKK